MFSDCGWDRRIGTARGEAEVGVNVNRLTDDSVREPLTGMPVYNGIPCRLEKAVAGDDHEVPWRVPRSKGRARTDPTG